MPNTTGQPKLKRGYAWLLFFAAILVAVVFVATPIWIIMPFKAQTQNGMAWSYAFKSWSPLVTILCSLLALALVVSMWRASRWWTKSFFVLAMIFTFAVTWMARQNHFEWMFHPITKAGFAKATEASFVDNKDMVMAIEINSEAVAYPIREMAYHHVVQSVIGGKPITATY